MRICNIIYLLIFLITCDINAQFSFEKNFAFNSHKESATDCIETSNGFIVATIQDDCGLCGASQGLVRLNNLGDTIWTKHYSHGTAYERMGPIINYKDGYIFADNFTSFNSIVTNEPISISRVDSMGNLLWQTIVEDTIRDLVCINVFSELSGNIFAGYYDSRNLGVFIIKLDSLGNILWQKNLGPPTLYGNVYDIISDSSNNYFILGGGRWNSQPVTYLMKVDSAGDSLWSKYYSSDTIYGQTLVIGDSSSIIIAGQKVDSMNRTQFSLLKVDSTGSFVWQTLLNSTNDNVPIQMAKTFDNGFAITGKKLDGTAEVRLIMMKADQTGQKKWEKTFCLPGCFSTAPVSIVETKDSMLLIGGQIQFIQTIPQIYVIKTDSLGNVILDVNDFLQKELYFQVYPNPGNGIYHISNSENYFTGYIYNSIGRLIKIIENTNEFNLLDFPGGIYFYCFLDSKNRLFNGKIFHTN